MRHVRLWPKTLEPYPHQLEFLAGMEQPGVQYGIARWHRRAGKDQIAFFWALQEGLKRRCNVSYYFPTQKLGRQVIWEGLDPADKGGFLSIVPPGVIRRALSQDLMIELANGSIMRILGTDTGEVVGPNPFACVFSEFALQSPTGWNYVSPILGRNGGKAVFVSTPRGMNHFHKVWLGAERSKAWLCSEKTMYHTGLFTDDFLRAKLLEGFSMDFLLQEYFVSWTAGLEYAYWERELREARESGRVSPGVTPIDGQPVYAGFDIGMDDHTAFWLFQYVNGKVYLFDYYDNSQEELATYLQAIHERTTRLDGIFMPWDVRKRDQLSHMTLEGRIQALGYNVVRVPRCTRVQDDIDLVRRWFGALHIDELKCSKGIYCLSAYRPNYDEKAQTFSMEPRRDYAAHGASALRTVVRACELGLVDEFKETVETKETFDTTFGGRVRMARTGRYAQPPKRPHEHILRRIRGPGI